MKLHQVLIVEDDPDIRQSLIDALEDHGFEAVSAINGRDALNKLDSPGVNPCLILLDLMMPVMDGRAFREEQLRRPGLAEVPVVVISALRDVADTAKDLNVHGYIPKPVRLTELIDVVESAC